ncbi:MAG: Maf family nucleotide pyrophosphatase [Gammaproteobacteria bacterium]
MSNTKRQLILASTSVFRRDLLNRLQQPFATVAPQTDETPLPGELPAALAERLAHAKARAVADRCPRSLVIGSDQVAVLGGEIIGKPGSHDRARAQLLRAAGNTMLFYTALCLIDSDSGRTQQAVVNSKVWFRRLDQALIERYLERDRPYQSAGSFKSEGLGIALFERIEGDDPTALIGLPLIRLVTMLAAEGITVP